MDNIARLCLVDHERRERHLDLWYRDRRLFQQRRVDRMDRVLHFCRENQFYRRLDRGLLENPGYRVCRNHLFGHQRRLGQRHQPVLVGPMRLDFPQDRLGPVDRRYHFDLDFLECRLSLCFQMGQQNPVDRVDRAVRTGTNGICHQLPMGRLGSCRLNRESLIDQDRQECHRNQLRQESLVDQMGIYCSNYNCTKPLASLA